MHDEAYVTRKGTTLNVHYCSNRQIAFRYILGHPSVQNICFTLTGSNHQFTDAPNSLVTLVCAVTSPRGTWNSRRFKRDNLILAFSESSKLIDYQTVDTHADARQQPLYWVVGLLLPSLRRVNMESA